MAAVGWRARHALLTANIEPPRNILCGPPRRQSAKKEKQNIVCLMLEKNQGTVFRVRVLMSFRGRRPRNDFFLALWRLGG